MAFTAPSGGAVIHLPRSDFRYRLLTASNGTMQQFKAFLDERRVALIRRLAGDDPAKTLRVYALAIFLAGLLAGCLVMALAQSFGVLFLLLAAGATGYLLRAFVSYRRREAFRRGHH